jgi:hypothetical protein
VKIKLLTVLFGLLIPVLALADMSAWTPPSSNGTYLQWTPSSGTAHAALIDESPCNGATDYVSTTTAGNRDSVATSLASVPDGSTITALDVQVCASRNATGTGTNTLKVFYRWSGADSSDSAALSLPNSTTPVGIGTSTFSGLSLAKGTGSTLEVGALYASGALGARLSRLSTRITYTPPATHVLTYETYVGPITGQSIVYGQYLPPGFDAGTTYPVVYWLHGAGGNQTTGPTTLVTLLDAAINAGTIEPAIWIFPNGGSASFYTDNCSGSWPIETMIVSELVPYIDTQFLIGSRAVHGFSMGGNGALKLKAKYPEIFDGETEVYAPAPGFGPPNPTIYADVYCSDHDVFEINSPPYWLDANAAEFQGPSPSFRIIVGTADSLLSGDEDLDAFMTGLTIEHDFGTLDGITHNVGSLYTNDPDRFLSLYP